jgi:hypothetical protein
MYVLCVTKDVMSRSSQLFDSICFWSCVALVVLLGINIKHHAPLFGLSPVLLLKSHCKPLASSKNSHLVIHKKKVVLHLWYRKKKRECVWRFRFSEKRCVTITVLGTEVFYVFITYHELVIKIVAIVTVFF